VECVQNQPDNRKNTARNEIESKSGSNQKGVVQKIRELKDSAGAN
jgi:hypothetical protein